ncbi:hypothetical protein EJF36_06180 [Bacillus sp. HMF5848]|uniref:hypothetical protein n=1 Tax=Bacillus sp. HMF5848 TaxID=2495421 RepID=UPI000F76FDD1|nr:hypothetical protein [Bacillus sp. HMF5848]RSK26480.1 hypothetical protein EJF36_06180 [Bacillus sp. HMF5848]
MLEYFFDFTIFAVIVIGITATMGVIACGIGEKFFSGKTGTESFDHSAGIQNNWKMVGGKK